MTALFSRAVAVTLALACLPAFAQNVGPLRDKKIAVLEFQIESDVRISSPGTLSDQARGAVVDVTRRQGAIVLTRENMLAVLKTGSGRCEEGECEVETARNLGVDFFVTGNLARIDSQLTLTLKVYETRKGALLGQRLITAPREIALLDLIKEGTAVLVRDALPRGVAREAPVQESRFQEAPKDLDLSPDEVLVRFESAPAGATVRLDGRLLCQATPCKKRVAPGLHEVVFEKERYFPLQQETRATESGTISGQLQPRFGLLDIYSTEPGLQVQVNGAPAGQTPVENWPADEGMVEVTLRDPCYAGAGESVEMKPGARRQVRLSATARVGGLKVNAEDEQGNAVDGSVWVDGREVGPVGRTVKVAVCSKEVVLRSAPFEWVEPLSLKEGEVITLQAAPRSRARRASPAASPTEPNDEAEKKADERPPHTIEASGSLDMGLGSSANPLMLGGGLRVTSPYIGYVTTLGLAAVVRQLTGLLGFNYLTTLSAVSQSVRMSGTAGFGLPITAGTFQGMPYIAIGVGVAGGTTSGVFVYAMAGLSLRLLVFKGLGLGIDAAYAVSTVDGSFIRANAGLSYAF